MVRSQQTDLLYDSRMIVGLTSQQVEEALDTVLNPLQGNMKYSDLLYAGAFENIFVYEHRFTLDFSTELQITDYSRFVDVIKEQFVAFSVFTQTSELIVNIVGQEEVFDVNGYVCQN